MAIATSITSSRLNRTADTPSEFQRKENVVSEKIIHYCQQALDDTTFFRTLQDGNISEELMQYTFLQYQLWRDRLHQWFGLCIVKADSCTDPDQKDALMALADHIFTDLKDDHSEMYVDFLHDIGVTDDDIMATHRSNATIIYEQSFFEDFGREANHFYEALAALAGRELCVAIRNQRILTQYFDALGLKRPVWLTLHAELELEHFHDAIRPVLMHYNEDSEPMTNLIQSIQQGIDRHVQYFESLLHEYESRRTQASM